MFHVVALLKANTDSELVVTADIKVSVDMTEAVKRIGAWKGSLFGVWDERERPNQQDAEAIANNREPDSIWVFSGPDLFRLDDEYLASVRGATLR